MEFSRQEYWSREPFLSPGNLLDPGIKVRSPDYRWILYCLSHQGNPYTRTSPDDQCQNQADYVLYSQRWRSSIQSAKSTPGADCGSDHEFLIAKFRFSCFLQSKQGRESRPFTVLTTLNPSGLAEYTHSILRFSWQNFFLNPRSTPFGTHIMLTSLKKYLFIYFAVPGLRYSMWGFWSCCGIRDLQLWHAGPKSSHGTIKSFQMSQLKSHPPRQSQDIQCTWLLPFWTHN